MQVLDAQQVREQLRARQTESARVLADEIGVSTQYLSDVLAGRRTLGPVLLDFLGLERVVTVSYIPKEKASK